jgi:hypothetical protein
LAKDFFYYTSLLLFGFLSDHLSGFSVKTSAAPCGQINFSNLKTERKYFFNSFAILEEKMIFCLTAKTD